MAMANWSMDPAVYLVVFVLGELSEIVWRLVIGHIKSEES